MKTIILIISLILVGCSDITDPFGKAGDSTYPALSGSYTHASYTSWGYVYESRKYMSYDFDSTDKAWYYSKNWSYTEAGWYNATKESYSADKTWKIVGDTFSSKLFDNDYSSWQDQTFEWIDDTHIKIGGYIYTKD